jgi:single-stranded DNA-binding protein
LSNENNSVTLKGTITEVPSLSHKVYGEGFYNTFIAVPRLSGSCDVLPVTVSERLLAEGDIVGKNYYITGQFRSYNNYSDSGNRLILTVFARDIIADESVSGKNPNHIFLNGFLCKKPVYRTTPFGREITDILIAVNRAYNKSDYIPCIAWGRNARFSSALEVGENIKIWGRIQSRDYQKKLDETSVITKTAYEVSISKMEISSKPNMEFEII